jgi:nitrogen fixation/metabolism regulation signal transduction histidine kinase
VLALPPVLLVYAFGVRFVTASVDTWLRANTAEAADAALELARLQLDARRAEALELATQISTRLTSPLGDAELALEDALDAVAAAQVALFDTDGRLHRIAAADPALLLPAPPEEALRTSLGARGRQVDPVRLGDRNYLRVLQPLTLQGRDLLLQVLFVLPAHQAELLARVEQAGHGVRQALFLRDSLKLVFVLILSFVALLSVFLALLIAFDLARRLVSPIGRLAAATREVAAGRLEPVELPPRGDELGFLVESFNRMTAELAASRERAASSAAETERQRAFLATVLARLSSAVLVVGPDGRLQRANAAARELCGPEAPALEQLQLDELASHAPELAPVAALAHRRLAEHAPEWREELAVGEASDARLLLVRGASLPDGGQVLVIDDTTALDRARREAAWSEVARRLAHEVKNPLTPIQLSAERLRRRVLPRLEAEDAEVLDRATHTIVAQVDALKTLVNAFGEYARPPQLVLQPTDVSALADEVLELYAHDPRLQIERDYAAASLQPRADAGRLRQVLHNLIKNAIEAGAAQPRTTLCLRLRERETGGRTWLDLVVEDNGPGLPPGFSADWFEPYRSSKPRGTGLGLAICRRIAEEHGGQLLAEPREGGGARFILRLPL